MASVSYARKITTAFAPKSAVPSLLGRLDIELTERCNNSCVHCYINLPVNDAASRHREMPAELIRRILVEAAALGCMMVRFTGGEPLLRPDFEELYVSARRQGLNVLLFTNATLLTPALADLLVRMPPREKVEVTVYGMTSASYEAVTRVPGSFAAAWRGIDLLREKNIPFVVKSVLLPQNKDDLEAFNRFAATIPWMNGHSPGMSMAFDLRARRDSPAGNERIRALRASAPDQQEVLARDRGLYIREMKDFCGKFMRPPGEKVFACGAGSCGGCVDAYGQFQMCMSLRHPEAVYDLHTGTLKDALENFFPRLRQTRAKSAAYLARCARCFLKGLCEQCPGKAWTEHGTLDTPVEYLCGLAHAQARFLGLLGGQESAWEVADWKERIRQFVSGAEGDSQDKGGESDGNANRA
jgi:radical SAM protein with 4Fe4S-binding SPASM domain